MCSLGRQIFYNGDVNLAATYHGAAVGTAEYTYDRYTDTYPTGFDDPVRAYVSWVDQAPFGFGGVDVVHKMRIGDVNAYNPILLGNASRPMPLSAGAVYLKGKHLNRLALLQDQSFIYGDRIYANNYARMKSVQYFAGNPSVKTVVVPLGVLNGQNISVITTTNTGSDVGFVEKDTNGMNGLPAPTAYQ